jgi:multiple sugar transport system permease protein
MTSTPLSFTTTSPGKSTAARQSFRRFFRVIEPYLYLAPAFTIFTLFMFVPLLVSLYLSFTDWDMISPMKFVGLDNYIRLFSDKNFLRAAGNTVYFTAGIVPAQIFLAIGVALLLNTKIRLRGFFRGLYFLPVIVPITVAATVWMFIFSPSFGILNYLLGLVGIEKIGWLSDPKWAMPALMILAVWQNFGYFAVMFLAGLQSIPSEMYEAAAIDGANAWKRFWAITFPLLSPTTFLVLVMSVIGGFQVYQTVVLTTEGGPAGATSVIVFELYRVAFEYYDMGYASAMAYVLFAFLFLLTLVQFKAMGSKVHYQ